MPEPKIIHTTPWLNLLSVDHDGKPYIYASRRKPGEELRTDTVSIVAEIGPKNLLLLKEFRPVVGETIYSLPAGLVDCGETEIEAAVREFREETGILVKPAEIMVMPGRPALKSPGLTDENVVTVMVMFDDDDGAIAAGLPRTVDGDEDIEVILVGKEEAVALLNDADALMTIEAKLWLMIFASS